MVKIMPNTYITATDIYKYFQCPHWPYYDRFATKEEKIYRREQTSGEKTRQEDGVAHEEKIIKEVLKGQEVANVEVGIDPIKACEETMQFMRKGVHWIYQGTLTYGNRTGRPDLLERREGRSDFGLWYYIPVDVKTSVHLQKYQKMQLTFYAELLKVLQGKMPEEAVIINIKGACISFAPADILSEFHRLMKDLERSVFGEKPPPVLRKNCYDVGVWGRICQRYAEETEDIALLYKVDIQKLKSLRSLGIRNIRDAAMIDPDTLAGQAKGLTRHGLEVIVAQAQSLLHQHVIIRKPVELVSKGLEIHFDIESDPPNDVDYLFGFLIREEAGDRYQAFVAESLKEEEKMWRGFLAWIETLPLEYTVYHFASFERVRLGVMEQRYGGSHWLDLFRSQMVDLREYASSYVTFPLYFYGLKYIAKFLGFHWRNTEVTTGGESVDQFERYLETGDRALLDAIVMYNEDDVRATALLKDWLVKYAHESRVYEKPFPWETAKSPFIDYR